MPYSETPTIIKQTPHWLAVDKPAMWSVHNAPGEDLVSYLREQSTSAKFQPSPIHRLDVGTSGLIIFALTQEAAKIFGGLLLAGGIQKQYLGISQGIPKHAKIAEWQEWSLPLSRKAEGRKNPAGLKKDRVAAVTKYRLREITTHRALLELIPVTGRKHQLRRHASMAGCSLLGDQRYGDKKAALHLAAAMHFDRLALHAQTLTFMDPWTKQVAHLEAPVPAEFSTLLS